MAVTLTSTGVTFSNGTNQNSAGSVLSGLQYTGYSAVNLMGYQGYTTSVTDSFFYNSDNMTNVPPSANAVMCGFQAYRSGNAQIGNDGTQDAGTIQRRIVYRTVS
jgi:hypothetical protein